MGQIHEYMISIVGIDGLVLYHQAIRRHNAEDAFMRFQLFI